MVQEAAGGGHEDVDTFRQILGLTANTHEAQADSQFDAAVPVLVGTVVVVLLVPDLGQLGRRHHVHCPCHPKATVSDLQRQKYFSVHEF